MSTKPTTTAVVKGGKSGGKGDDTFLGAMIDQAAERLPKYAPYIKQVKPYVVMAGDAADAAYPYCVQAVEFGRATWKKLEPYNPEQFLPFAFGLVLCFFGGSYVTLLAAVEAVRMTVWSRMVTAFTVLADNYQKAAAASKKDDEVDADGNGVADVKELSKKDLVTRKLFLVAKTVDPDKASEALALLWGAALSIVATLRVQFAQAVTLGNSFGDMANKHLGKSVEPVLEALLPPELKKWGPTASRYIFKSVGITIAWFLARVISGFHSAIRGGHMAVLNGIRLAKKHGYLEANFDEESPRTSAFATAVGLIGFYWQLSNGFSLPFPLNLLFLPVTILEWTIELVVGL